MSNSSTIAGLQRLGLDHVTPNVRGGEGAAAQHAKHEHREEAGPMREAAVVDIGKTSVHAKAYAPGGTATDAKIAEQVKQSLTQAQSKAPAAGAAEQAASANLNVRGDVAVQGGSIVLMDGAKVTATVRVDLAAAGTPPPPPSPAATAIPVGTRLSSVDAFRAVEPLQSRAVTQTTARQEDEPANSESDGVQTEDPRWRLFRNALESVDAKPTERREHRREKEHHRQPAHGKVHVKS